MPIVFREAEPDDVNFVTNTWMRSFRDSDTAGFIGLHNWASAAETEIRRILAREGVELYVAWNPSGRKDLKIDLHGWIAVERGFYVPTRVIVNGRRKRVMKESIAPLVHYCFVKPHYRKQKIARGLFDRAGVDPTMPFLYSCSTVDSISIRRARKIPGGKWDPKICRFPRDYHKERRHAPDPSSENSIQQPDAGGARL